MSSFHWSVSSFLYSSLPPIHLSDVISFRKKVVNVPFIDRCPPSCPLHPEESQNKVPLLYLSGRRLSMFLSLTGVLLPVLFTLTYPSLFEESQKQGIAISFGKMVANVVFSLNGGFLTGLIHLFFSLRNLNIRVTSLSIEVKTIRKVVFYISWSVSSSLFWGSVFSTFMQMYLTWGPLTWALTLGCPL